MIGHHQTVSVRKVQLVDQDEAAMWAGEGGERSRERAREVGPPRREEGWAPKEGGQRLLEGLRRQEYIGVFSVRSRQLC